ncbi:RICIN domain-containing protein [Nonomuraea sp. NPDC003707]
MTFDPGGYLLISRAHYSTPINTIATRGGAQHGLITPPTSRNLSNAAPSTMTVIAAGLAGALTVRCAMAGTLTATAAQANVIQANCSYANNQRWWLPGGTYGSGYQMVVAKHSDKCLDVAWASYADGANILQSSCWNGANQQWLLSPF